MNFTENKEKTKISVSRKTIIVFLLIYLVLITCSSAWLRQCAYDKSIAIPVEATVTDIRSNREDTGVYHKIYISYSYYNDNVQNEYWGEVSDLTVSVGDKMIINIVPEHPVRIYKESDAKVVYVVFGILLSLLIEIFLGILFFNGHSKDKIETIDEKTQLMIMGSRICFSLGYIFLLGCFLITKLPLSGFLVPGIILVLLGMTLSLIMFIEMKELNKRNVNGLLFCLSIVSVYVGVMLCCMINI